MDVLSDFVGASRLDESVVNSPLCRRIHTLGTSNVNTRAEVRVRQELT
jgi:hypothetical protein